MYSERNTVFNSFAEENEMAGNTLVEGFLRPNSKVPRRPIKILIPQEARIWCLYYFMKTF